MAMPGFTAEASVYRSGWNERASPSRGEIHPASRVEPQFPFLKAFFCTRPCLLCASTFSPALCAICAKCLD